MTIKEFKVKWGHDALGFQLVLEEFISKAPEFKGDGALAGLLGEAMADLASALRSSDVKIQ